MENKNNKIVSWYTKKTRAEKTSFWTKVIIWTLAITFLIIFLLSPQIFGANSIMGSLITNSPNGFASLGTWFKDNAQKFIMTLVIIIACTASYFVLKFLLTLITFKSKAAKTVTSLLISIIKYALIIAALFLILQRWGVDTSTLVASLGILTLVIGLGCQSLINDIISGLFLITEKSFELGDIVVVDGFRGTVKEIGVRSTKIIDASGNIKIINNSNIGTVINLSQELSVAVVDSIELPYEVPLETAEAVFADHLSEIKEKIPAIVEGPFYKGVTGYESDAGISIKFVAKCKEEDRYQVERDLNRAIYIMMSKYGIDIPYSHIMVGHFGNDERDATATKKEEKKAAEFNNDQKEKSVGIEEQHK